MAASAAEYYEVRYREVGVESWSDAQRFSPMAEVIVAVPDREKAYETEVRAVSACGAKSVWVPANYTVPTAPAGTIRLDELQTATTGAQADIATEVADRAAAIAAERLAREVAVAAANVRIADMLSDAIISPEEKPQLIRDVAALTAERPGILVEAAASEATVAASDYDAATTALLDYIGSLNTPVAWNDTTGNTVLT